MGNFDFQQTGPVLQEIINSVGGKAEQTEVNELRALYEALTQSNIVPVPSADWPVSNPQVNVIYRVAGTSSYTDYMWDGTDFIPMATYDNVPTDIPTVGSTDVITAGGVANHGSAFDISEYNKNGATLATYANLSAALAAVPSSVQKGGMSIKFVRSSDNKYVQYRYTGTVTTGTPNPFLDVRNWKGGELMITPSYTELDGLLSNTGSIVSGTRFYHTSPIELKVGQYLVVKNAIQVNSFICSIALVENDGTFIMPIYQYGVYGKWEYTFTPVKDCYVSISYYTQTDDDKVIGIVNNNDAYEKKLATLKNWLYTESYIIRGGTVVRDADGNVTSCDVYYPDKTLGHVAVTRDSNYNVTQLVFTYLNEDMTMTIARDTNGYVTGTSITI